jgi:fermentation-respiration switch protein FrsA (DUF1100 family)
VLKLFKYLAIAVVGLYAGACGFMYFQQRSLVFNPGTEDVAKSVDQVTRAELVTLSTPDGETLKAWWVAPQAGKPVYFYLHGNAGTLLGSFSDPHGRADRFNGLVSDGAGLLALSWRGYGGSTGSPTEAGFRIDAATALAWLQQQVPQASILLFGESLGTGIAVQLAAEHEFAALILDSPYTSIVDVGAGRYPWLPVRPLSKDHFESLIHAGNVTEPVLIQHCDHDVTVPYEQSLRLFAAMGSAEKTFRHIAGQCHVPSIFPQLPLLREFEKRFTRAQ